MTTWIHIKYIDSEVITWFQRLCWSAFLIPSKLPPTLLTHDSTNWPVITSPLKTYLRSNIRSKQLAVEEVAVVLVPLLDYLLLKHPILDKQKSEGVTHVRKAGLLQELSHYWSLTRSMRRTWTWPWRVWWCIDQRRVLWRKSKDYSFDFIFTKYPPTCCW